MTRMCGGVLSICCRSYIGVSPVLTATRMGGIGEPFAPASSCDLAERPLKILMDVIAQRFKRRNVYNFCFILQGAVEAFRTSRSMHNRNAARVLPEPVGAEISTSRPAEISFQACSCGCRRTQTNVQTIPGLVGETSWRGIVSLTRAAVMTVGFSAIGLKCSLTWEQAERRL